LADGVQIGGIDRQGKLAVAELGQAGIEVTAVDQPVEVDGQAL